MIEILIVVALLSVCGFVGGFWGWHASKAYHAKWHDYELEREKKSYELQLENIKGCFKENLTDIIKTHNTERQELTNRNIRILDEISKVTGIDKIELPSFGTVYLNHSEKLRAAMQAIYEEE